MNKKSNLLIIGSGWEQIPLIKEGLKSNINLVLTDPSKKAEGFNFSKNNFEFNPRNLHLLPKIINDWHIDAVVSDQCDYSRYATVFASHLINNKIENLKVVQLTTNKKWMRNCCAKHGVLQPEYKACWNLTDVYDFLKVITFPAIIKPVDNRGSFGVSRMNNIDEVEDAFYLAIANSHSRQVIVEKWIEGTHLTVDGCIDQDGVHHNLSLSTKKILMNKIPIITDILFPGDISESNKEKIFKINDIIVNGLEIKDGLTHSEFIIDKDDNVFLLETANRGGGILISGLIIPEITKVNVSKLLIKNALNEDFKVLPQNTAENILATFLIFSPGKVKKICGLNNVKKLPFVLYSKMLIEEGQLIDLPKSGGERHFYLIIKGSNKYNVHNNLEIIKKMIKIEYY